MTDPLPTLGLRINRSGIRAAKKALRALAIAAERAERASDRIAKANTVTVSVDVNGALFNAYVDSRAQPYRGPQKD